MKLRNKRERAIDVYVGYDIDLQRNINNMVVININGT